MPRASVLVLASLSLLAAAPWRPGSDMPSTALCVQVGHLSMCQWWYGTIATFQRGGSARSGWYGKLKGEFVGHQRDDDCAAGSWDPLGTYERQTGGRVLATALGVLVLEQPYRHRRME